MTREGCVSWYGMPASGAMESLHPQYILHPKYSKLVKKLNYMHTFILARCNVPLRVARPDGAME